MIQNKNILLTLGFILLLMGTSFSIDNNMFQKAPVDTSQAYLEIIRRKDNKTIKVKVGKIITIWTKDLKFKGEVTKITYNKIYINHAPFLISEIYHIKAKTVLYSVIGVIMQVEGAIVVLSGLMYISTYGEALGLFVIMEGGILIWWGTDMFKGRTFKHKKWKYGLSENDAEMNFITD